MSDGDLMGEVYKSVIISAEEILRGLRVPLATRENRAKAISYIESVLFEGSVIPPEFRRIREGYVSKGLDSLA